MIFLALCNVQSALGRSSLRFVDGTKDFSKVVVAAAGPGIVPEYYASILPVTRELCWQAPAAKNLPTAKTSSHWINTRDGQEINVYVTMPAQKSASKAPLSCFLMVDQMPEI